MGVYNKRETKSNAIGLYLRLFVLFVSFWEATEEDHNKCKDNHYTGKNNLSLSYESRKVFHMLSSSLLEFFECNNPQNDRE